MGLVWGKKEKKEHLEYLRERRKRIVELSNVKVYNIIKKLMREISAKDALYVIGLVGCSRYYVCNPDLFNRQLQHVYDSLEFSERDKEILHKHLKKAEEERLKREEEKKEFEKNRKPRTVFLPRIGIN